MMFPYEIETLLNLDGLQDMQEILDRLVKVREYSREKVTALGYDVKSLDLDSLPSHLDKEEIYWLSFYKNLFNFISIPLWVNGVIDRQEINSIRFDDKCLHDIAEILTGIEQGAS